MLREAGDDARILELECARTSPRPILEASHAQADSLPDRMAAMQKSRPELIAWTSPVAVGKCDVFQLRFRIAIKKCLGSPEDD